MIGLHTICANLSCHESLSGSIQAAILCQLTMLNFSVSVFSLEPDQDSDLWVLCQHVTLYWKQAFGQPLLLKAG